MADKIIDPANTGEIGPTQARTWARIIAFAAGAISMAAGARGVVPSLDPAGLAWAMMTIAWAMIWGTLGATFVVTGLLLGDPELPADALKKSGPRLRGADALPSVLIAAAVELAVAAVRTALDGAGTRPALLLLGIAGLAGLGVRPALEAFRERVLQSLRKREYVSVDAPPAMPEAKPLLFDDAAIDPEGRQSEL